MKRELPGHIKKAFRSVDKFLPVVDLIVELVDARMPWGSRLRGFVERLDKKYIIALGKSDLAEESETKKWIERFKSEGKTCVELDSRNTKSVKYLAKLISKVAFSNEGKQPSRSARRVMIIGIPNVGKSTLINSLAGRKAARTANKPGVTRSIQWIKLAGKLELLDLPGILDFGLLRRGDILQLINTMPGRDENQYGQAKLLFEVLKKADRHNILPGINDEVGFDAYIEDYALRMNFIMKGAVADKLRASADMIRRFQSGKFGHVTLERTENVTTADISENQENDDGGV